MNDYSETGNQTNGRWTKQEHSKFLIGLRLYGKNWKKIEEVVKTRSGSQIRSHAQKFFLKVKKVVQNEDYDQSPQEMDPTQTVISKSNQEKDQVFSEYSYFFGEILKKDVENIGENFWNLFIDQKNSASLDEKNITMRKCSFITFDSYEYPIVHGSQEVKESAQ